MDARLHAVTPGVPESLGVDAFGIKGVVPLLVPLLDEVVVGLVFVGRVLAMPAAERFTDPAKQALVGVCPQAAEFAFFSRKKMGFNPPIRSLLKSLQGRLAGLPERLSANSANQLPAAALTQALAQWRSDNGYGEQLLQLLILDESLQQLASLARALHD